MKKMKSFLCDPLRPPRLVEKDIEIMHLFAGYKTMLKKHDVADV